MAKESVPNRRYTDEFKLEALRVAESVGINQTPKRLAMPIRVWGTGRGRSEAESLPRAASGSLKGLPAELEAENNRLRRELANTQLDLELARKSGGVFREGAAVRYAWIERHRDDYQVARMCRQREVSRTGYLQWRRRLPIARPMANTALDARVAAIHR